MRGGPALATMESMKTSIGDQLQQLWQTRPVRMSRQGPVAGVAAGFGRRYAIDPVLIRIAFVVSTLFGGAGIVLYLLAWLMLDDIGDATAPPRSLLDKSQSQTKTVVLIVALAIAVSTMGPVGVGLGGSGLISMALMLGGWWLLFLRTPQPPPGLPAPVPDFATGFFPTGAPLRPQQPEPFHPTGPFTPYTKLPDAYVPERREGLDVPAPAAPPQPAPDAAAGEPQVAAGTPQERAETTTSATVPVPLLDATTPVPAEPARPGLLKADPTPEPVPEQPTPPKAPDLAKKPGAPAVDAAARTPEATGGSPARSQQDMASRMGMPPSWDPLGVAPLAWDLPEPTPAKPIVQPQPEKRPRSRLTPVVIGLAILAAAGAGAAAAAGVEWMTPARIGAAALAVLGLGLIAGSFLRRGYGLLAVTAPVAGFVLLASLIGPIEFDRSAMGEHVWTPSSAADLAPEYRINMGNGTLDLRDLTLTEDRAVNLDIRMGDAKVLLPAGLTVNTSCDFAMTDSECPSGITGPATPGAPVLDLNIDIRAGNVEVVRG